MTGEADGPMVDVHVFLEDSVPVDALSSVVDDLVAAAATGGPAATIGRIHKYAKSFSLIAPPGMVEAIAASPRVKSVVENARIDAYPKPVNIRVVD